MPRARWLLSIIAVSNAVASSSAAAQSKTVVFFDPDANHQAIVAVTAHLNRYLDSHDPALEFRPVRTRTDFDRLVADKATGFAVVSSGYLRSADAVKLVPLLVPAVGGSVSFKKLLVVRDAVGAPPKTIAVAGDEAAAKAALSRVGFSVHGAIFTPVSKDIDAVLALSFGQVEGALVTRASLDGLKKINPSAGQQIRVLAETKPILRSPLCAVQGHASDAERKLVVGAFSAMGSSDDGRKAMSALGYQEWVTFRTSMLQP